MTEADGKPRASTGHARAICVAPSVGHPPTRGTSRCAPGTFSLTAPVFRSSRAQKGAWCAPHGSDGRRGYRRWELTGDDRHRKVQEGAGRRKLGPAERERRCRKTQAGAGRKGTAVQEDASGDRQEGNGGAGRRKRGQAGRERRCRKTQAGTGRKGTAVQEDASGDRQEGNGGAGRRKRGQAGRERRCRKTQAGTGRKGTAGRDKACCYRREVD